MFLGLSLITNCASITSGDTQTVAISTPLCVKATCEIVNGQGQYYVAMTPGMVQINQSASDLVITCSKNDISKVISVASGTARSTLGNILLGGGIGALYDMQTGAAYKYDSNIDTGFIISNNYTEKIYPCINKGYRICTPRESKM